MIVLYILAGIALLIVFVLASSISVYLKLSDGFSVKLGFWCFRFDLTDYIEKKSNAEKQKKAEDTDKKNYIKRLIEQKGLVSALSELLGIAKVIIARLGKLAAKVRIRRFLIKLTVASPDPAKTAFEYGTACALVFPAVNGFQQLFKWNGRKTDVTVDSDFSSDTPTVSLDLKLKLRLGSIVKAGLDILIKLVKIKVKEAMQNQKNISSADKS